MIKISFNQQNSKFESLIVTVDGQPVTYTMKNNEIIVDGPMFIGLHELTLAIVGERLEIIDASINGCSVRQGLYFSFLKDGDDIYQPASTIWKQSQIWFFRFGNPVSHWIKLLNEKFSSNELGTNLLEKFDIYWPESIDIDQSYPQLIKDYFKYNFDFLVLEKTNRSKHDLPYCTIDNFVVPVEVLNEIYENIDYIQETQTVPSQHQYNIVDDQSFNKDKAWSVSYLYRKNCKNLDATRLPYSFNFVDSLCLDISFAFIGILNPRQYVMPHRDLTYNPLEKYAGCTQIYIPLDWPDGACYFKFADVGLLPQKVCVINNQNFVHGLINDTNRCRVVIGIGCDIVKAEDKFNLDITD